MLATMSDLESAGPSTAGEEVHVFAIPSTRKALVEAWFSAFRIAKSGVPLALVSQTQAPSKSEVSREFETTLAKVDGAQLELQNGRAAASRLSGHIPTTSLWPAVWRHD